VGRMGEGERDVQIMKVGCGAEWDQIELFAILLFDCASLTLITTSYVWQFTQSLIERFHPTNTLIVVLCSFEDSYLDRQGFSREKL
jgi:hypothetical protein